MRPPSRWGRRTKRLIVLFFLALFIILVVILLGVFPISWILSPSSLYFPKEGRSDQANPAPAVHFPVANLPPALQAPQQVHFEHAYAVPDSVGPEERDVHSVSVDIISDAAIGMYLWQHVLKGQMVSKLNAQLFHGFLKVNDISFRFRTGPAVTPDAPIEDKHIVLVLNGRSDPKVQRSKQWLELIPISPNVLNVAVVLLGNEQCNNEWLYWYLESVKYKIRAVFMVYDSKMVDGKRVFQWPLGVATYRGFPLMELKSGDIVAKRRYLCHFMGTVYRNNSRLELMKVLEGSKFKDKCYLKVRYEWPESETEDSAADYLRSLEQSESVLSPLGMNAECYRIYEALSVGVLPIIEDQKAPGMCDDPHRLLKEYNVPAIFLTGWDELPAIMEYLDSLSDEELMHQRNKIIRWYAKFLDKLKDKFVSVIKQNFVLE